MSIKNDRLLRAIRREALDATPIWIMRQAGRYLPEYREIRQKAGSFLKLCKTPELATLVTLQPLKRYPLDAAILFSDILTIPDAMGLGLYFKEGEGPGFEKPVRDRRAIDQLPLLEPETMLSYVLDTIQLIQQDLSGKVPLIGFCGSPWTLACYMVEGRGHSSFPIIRQMLDKEPNLLHLLLDKLAKAVSAHLFAQIKAGVEIVMLFDTWGGMLSDLHYQAFSLQYLHKIILELKAKAATPIILFTKGGGGWLQLMAETGCDVIGIDWLTNLGVARRSVGEKVALQGNMDPAILYQTPDRIRSEVSRILAEYGSGSGHIFNLGHGIPQDVSPDHVAHLVDAVHVYSQQYHEDGQHERGSI